MLGAMRDIMRTHFAPKVLLVKCLARLEQSLPDQKNTTVKEQRGVQYIVGLSGIGRTGPTKILRRNSTLRT